ncbi:unnamed protein product [Urochloa humidicola]
MDPSDRSFSRLLASDPTNPRSENRSIHPMQNFPPNSFNPSQFAPPPFNHSQYPQNSPQTQVMQNFNPFSNVGNSPPTQVMQNFNPFSSVGNNQQNTQCFPSFQGFRQQHYFGVPGGIFGSAGGASSHGSDSTSPQSQREVQQVQEDSSGSSPSEVRRAVRVNYSEEENLRLTSAWLKHSVDSIRGNDQTGESYWKSVAEEFNSNKPQGARTRSKVQLKSHWGKISAAVAKFNGVYGRMDFCSGESDDMLMDKARAVFKRENKEKPFTLEYVWKILKDQPKWRRIGLQEEKNKRTKVDEYGAYTSSSNPDTDEGDRQKEKCPEGQKRAKARIRGKGKEKTLPQSPLGMQPDEDMVLFHDAMSKRADALAKTAAVAAEKVRFDKIAKYMEYMDKDTTNFTAARKKVHDQICAQLEKELFPPSDD